MIEIGIEGEGEGAGRGVLYISTEPSLIIRNQLEYINKEREKEIDI